MIDEGIIRKAVTLINKAVPGARVILFGSHARGDARPDSDLDLLIVEPTVDNRHAEMARLSALLATEKIPADVVVVSAAMFEYWKDTPNTLAYRALREGRIYEQVA